MWDFLRALGAPAFPPLPLQGPTTPTSDVLRQGDGSRTTPVPSRRAGVAEALGGCRIMKLLYHSLKCGDFLSNSCSEGIQMGRMWYSQDQKKRGSREIEPRPASWWCSRSLRACKWRVRRHFSIRICIQMRMEKQVGVAWNPKYML